MAKQKIHELAKELNKSSKEILDYLNKNGVEVKSHMSSIEDTQIDMVKKEFAPKAEAPKVEAPKAEEAKTEEAPKKKSAGGKPALQNVANLLTFRAENDIISLSVSRYRQRMPRCGSVGWLFHGAVFTVINSPRGANSGEQLANDGARGAGNAEGFRFLSLHYTPDELVLSRCCVEVACV